MITLIRTATSVGSKYVEAAAWAHEIGNVVERITGAKTRVGGPFGGTTTDICWITQFESLAQLEQAGNKLIADPAYVGMLKSSAGLFVDGAIRDQIYSTD